MKLVKWMMWMSREGFVVTNKSDGLTDGGGWVGFDRF